MSPESINVTSFLPLANKCPTVILYLNTVLWFCMNNDRIFPRKNKPLEQLLRRGDVWRGHSRVFLPQEVVSSGFDECNKVLLNGGWPRSKLIECYLQHDAHAGEWLLFTPSITALCQEVKEGFFVLLNPPAIPFAPALIQAGLPLNQLLVAHSKNKKDFLACFIEFTRSAHCLVLLAWQTSYTLNYTELRKCQLACAEGKALYTLFRPMHSKMQSSPSPLRLTLQFTETALELEIFKQQGMFNKRRIAIELTEHAEYDPHSSAQIKLRSSPGN